MCNKAGLVGPARQPGSESLLSDTCLREKLHSPSCQSPLLHFDYLSNLMTMLKREAHPTRKDIFHNKTIREQKEITKLYTHWYSVYFNLSGSLWGKGIMKVNHKLNNTVIIEWVKQHLIHFPKDVICSKLKMGRISVEWNGVDQENKWTISTPRIPNGIYSVFNTID